MGETHHNAYVNCRVVMGLPALSFGVWQWLQVVMASAPQTAGLEMFIEFPFRE